MSEDTTYNGWKNRATWLVNLWVMNEEPTYFLTVSGRPFTARSAEHFYRHEIPSEMKAHVKHDMGLETSLDDVDWQEIADSWNEE